MQCRASLRAGLLLSLCYQRRKKHKWVPAGTPEASLESDERVRGGIYVRRPAFALLIGKGMELNSLRNQNLKPGGMLLRFDRQRLRVATLVGHSTSLSKRGLILIHTKVPFPVDIRVVVIVRREFRSPSNPVVVSHPEGHNDVARFLHFFPPLSSDEEYGGCPVFKAIAILGLRPVTAGHMLM